jgi:hypothetical protein
MDVSHVICGSFFKAGIAQLVEQLTCNQQVAGSIPAAGSLHYQQLAYRRRLSCDNLLGHFLDTFKRFQENRKIVGYIPLWCHLPKLLRS